METEAIKTLAFALGGPAGAAILAAYVIKQLFKELRSVREENRKLLIAIAKVDLGDDA